MTILACVKFSRQLTFFLNFQVHLRHKFARLQGYSNYADYAVHYRMARSSAKVIQRCQFSSFIRYPYDFLESRN